MDTVRSEYSESSLTSARLDDGSGTSRSFSLSSHTSRLSTESASARSDYLSNYERKFLERKAAKHKKSERAKREKERADRQQLFSADERRKAQREAERQARRREMETWLTDPKELRRIELRSQKRSRDRMRTLQDWYVLATSEDTEEVQPVFVAAMNQEQSNQEQSTRSRLMKPLFPTAMAAVKNEEEREAYAAVLHRQLNAFSTKLSYLEQFSGPFEGLQAPAKMRAGQPRRRRRIAKDALQLAPLQTTSNGLQTAKSVASLPRFPRKKLSASASLQVLRTMTQGCIEDEKYEAELDDAEIEQYLARHRKVAKQNYASRKIQATWRMHLRRRAYLPWYRRRMQHRRAIFELWLMTHRVGIRALRSLMRKYFSAWHGDVIDILELREMELHLFRQAATQKDIPRMVINLVFTSDWEHDGGKHPKTADASKATTTESIATSKAAFLGAFLSATFAGVESPSDKSRSRVSQLRAQHEAAREEVRRKIAQHVFLVWKRLHEAKKRVGINAQLCLKRAVRMAFGSRQRWPAETLLTVFEIWSRWATFNRCKRLGLPLPNYTTSNPHWDIWLHNYQERQVRCVKAAAKAPGARLRRYFLHLHAFARGAIRKRRSIALASEHHARVLARTGLLEWREAIADSATDKKITRDVLLRFHRYACAKRKLRPLKLILQQRHRESFYRRAWRAWQRVQLHAVFKRELNLARLENSQVWRSRLLHTLAVWRGERDNLVLWRTFEAWTHFVRKRKLFLTMRLICARQQRRNLLFSVFTAWKSTKWDRIDGFLEDQLRLDAWDAYREISAFFPMLFYGTFSDAGSIFGGLPSNMYGGNVKVSNNSPQRLKHEIQELELSTSGDAVRHFHGVLVRDSVVDARNAILQGRHLVNAVDDASGNTALHVAAQIEEPVRRLEILGLLLSEGATTLKRANRHGLTPLQLAPDPDTNLLLGEGIFAFHSRNVLDRERIDKGTEDDHRLLWCVVTLMARELSVDLRIPANVHTNQWHSSLRDELWLRQKIIRFAPDSTFGPAVTRSRGLLNALKTRICRSYEELLFISYPSKFVSSMEDADKTRQQRYYEWEQRAKERNIRASATGEYEAYARYLLATTLDTEACEQALIPSFVGLLFSLDFSVNEVLSQAYRFEAECTKAEFELWELYQRIRKVEKAWSQRLFPYANSDDPATKSDVGLLRIFSNDANADLFFQKKLFLLKVDQLKEGDDGPKDEDGDRNWHLLMELDGLMTRMQRKLRKVEKKVKRVQYQIDASERSYRTALFANTRVVEDICATRMALEQEHLRMAMALIKHSEVQTVVARFEIARRVLQGDKLADDDDSKTASSVMETGAPSASFEERKHFLEAELSRYSGMFQTKVILEEERDAAKRNADPASAKHEDLPGPLYQLQKEATIKLHMLLLLNLFRSCCCWLGENMLAVQEVVNTERSSESESDNDEATGIKASSTEASAIEERKSIGMERLLTAAALLAEGMPRRRSSLRNTRRVLETYHRGCTMVDLLDPDSDSMSAKYAASADLLFEEERHAVQEAERELSNTQKVETATVILERNPVTGQIEVPPDHVVDVEAIPASAPSEVAVDAPTTIPRNRKKEELQRAIKHRQLQRKDSDSSEAEVDNAFDALQNELLPVIHGTELNFGNFVAGNVVWGDGKAKQASISSQTALMSDREIQVARNIEAIWKRGGVKLADSSAPSIKEVLANAHRTSTSRERSRPVSRRQGIQGSSDLMQSLEEIPVVETSKSKGDGLTRSKDLGAVQGEDKPMRRESVSANLRRLERAGSTSSLLPVVSALSTSPVELETKVNEGRSRRHSGNSKEQQSSHDLHTRLDLPAIEITTGSRQNSAGSIHTGPKFAREEGDSPILISQLDTFEKQQQLEEKQDSTNTRDFVTKSVAVSDEHEPAMIEVLGGIDQEQKQKLVASTYEPAEKMSTSPTSESLTLHHGELQEMKFAQTQESTDTPTVETGIFDNSVNAFIKWEEMSTLEAFPLAVVANKQPQSVIIGNKRSSLSRERSLAVSRISSFHAPNTQIAHEADELSVVYFAISTIDETNGDLEHSTDQINNGFALHGKGMAMAKQTRRIRRKSIITDTQEDQLGASGKIAYLKASQNCFDDIPSTPLLTPSIKVTVVMKPAKREVEVYEPIEIVTPPPILELNPLENAWVSSPKPWVKLQPSPDAEVELNTQSASQLELHLEGMGLSYSAKSLHARESVQQLPYQEVANTKNNHKPIIQDKLKNREQKESPSKVRFPVFKSRSRAYDAATAPSSGNLTLQGARMTVPSIRQTSKVQEQIELSGFEGMDPLSKTHKELIWQEFAGKPLSSTILDAYTILYPQTYPIDRASKDVRADLVKMKATNQPPPLPVAASPLRHMSLRVDSTHQPLQKEIEQGRKFWSAVEGYKTIGSSSLVPLDAATITQRRRDKAQAIYEQFFRGQRSDIGSGDYRGLPLAWLDMYPKEVAEVHRQLARAPKDLFDEVQRTAELHIAGLLAKQHTEEQSH